MPLKVLLSEPEAKSGSAEYRYRYGWEMYTRTEIDVTYASIDSSGARRQRNAVAELGRLWGNVDYGSTAVRRLCDADPSAVEVVRLLQPRASSRPSRQRFMCD